MGCLELESSSTAYRADFAIYSLAVAGLAVALLVRAPAPGWHLLGLVAGGYVLWSLLEYLLHRFVLHRVQPFRRMHEQHHLRPHAYIGTPTVVSAPLFAVLVLAPSGAMAGLWPACALTLGVLGGYLVYTTIHHICHHGRIRSVWFANRRRWHGRHHVPLQPQGCYGVSHSVWDHIFGTARTPFRPAPSARGHPHHPG
jgi:sterol desaturase/sphingolipid hydroxylase (fatty acid hydroxylase superfamily)